MNIEASETTCTVTMPLAEHDRLMLLLGAALGVAKRNSEGPTMHRLIFEAGSILGVRAAMEDICEIVVLQRDELE